MTEIKPCPFCGSVAMLQKRKKHKDFPYRVKCSNINCGCKTTNWNNAWGAINSWNSRMKFADVQPVKHGRWIWTETGNEDYEQFWVCSVCGEHDFYEAKYCPNCGARMEVDDEHTD